VYSVSPGGISPVDYTKISRLEKCVGGIGGFGGIDAFGGIDGCKKARRLFVAVLHCISRNVLTAVPANPLPDVWFRTGT